MNFDPLEKESKYRRLLTVSTIIILITVLTGLFLTRGVNQDYKTISFFFIIIWAAWLVNWAELIVVKSTYRMFGRILMLPVIIFLTLPLLEYSFGSIITKEVILEEKDFRFEKVGEGQRVYIQIEDQEYLAFPYLKEKDLLDKKVEITYFPISKRVYELDYK